MRRFAGAARAVDFEAAFTARDVVLDAVLDAVRDALFLAVLFVADFTDDFVAARAVPRRSTLRARVGDEELVDPEVFRDRVDLDVDFLATKGALLILGRR